MKKIILFIVLFTSTLLNAQVSSWVLTGNSNAIGSSKFLGTTNNNSLRFRTNNLQRMILDSTGNLGIGIAAPAALIHGFKNANTFISAIIENPNAGSGSAAGLGLYSNSAIGSLYAASTAYVAPFAGNVNLQSSTGLVLNSISGDILILPSGKVGIGLTNPLQTLDVNGTGLFANTLFLVKNINWSNSFTPVASNYEMGLVIGDFYNNVPAGNNHNHTIGGVSSLFLQYDGKVGIGQVTPTQKLDVHGGITDSLGYWQGVNKILGLEGTNFPTTNISIGVGAARGAQTNAYNITAVGGDALGGNTSGHDLVAIGRVALTTNSTGNQSTAVGVGALQAANSTDNSAFGYLSLNTMTSGARNAAIGASSGYSNMTGNENVFLGYHAGYYEMGSSKIYIGSTAGNNEADGRRKIAIYAVQGGDSTSTTVTINGTPQFSNSTAGAGKVLTSDANGVGTWQASGNIAHTIFTPTVGATVSTVNNQINIVSPAGTLASLTINFPNSPANNDFIEVTFDQIITTVTYAAGTGGATIKGQINGVVGGQKRWDYDSGTNTWY